MSDDYRPDVVAGKYDPTLFDPEGQSLLVNEVFYSLQGEGRWAGRAAVFVRLAKCNLKCRFCDTEFEVGTLEQVTALVHRIMSAHQGTSVQPMVVLTGGEPVLQNCGPLVRKLDELGYFVAVETSGSVYASWLTQVHWVCLSPKVKLSAVNPLLWREVDEVKWIVNGAFLKMLETGGEVWAPGKTNYLQPESLDRKWTDAAIKLVKSHPDKYRLSLQTHKLTGIQ